MKKDKFQEAVRLYDQKSYLLSVKKVVDGAVLELRDSSGCPIKIKGTLLKKLNEIVDEEIREVDQKIENL